MFKVVTQENTINTYGNIELKLLIKRFVNRQNRLRDFALTQRIMVILVSNTCIGDLSLITEF